MENTPDLIVPSLQREPGFKGSFREIAEASHVHNDKGVCIKNRFGEVPCA